jgi:hypothetical protein
MSVWSTILKIAPYAAAPFTGGASLAAVPFTSAIGSTASGAAKGMASNRGTQIDVGLAEQKVRQDQQDAYQRAQLAKSQEDRTSLTDAMKKLAVSEYRANAQPYTPPVFHSNVAGVRDFTPATPANLGIPGPMSDFERAGPAGMQQEIMKRLAGQSTMPVMPPNPYEAGNQYTVDPKLRKGGIWEKIFNILGPAASIYGAARGSRGGSAINSDSSINT